MPPKGYVKKEVPASPLPSHMTLGQAFKLSEPQYSPAHWEQGGPLPRGVSHGLDGLGSP